MLTREECKEIIEAGVLEFQDAATLDCRINQLSLHATGSTLALSEPQKRLLVCLFKGINCKRQIINIVWYEYHQRIGDNNYHQLVFQLRALLKQHQLPATLILTVPYYGLKINEPLLLDLPVTSTDDSVMAETPAADTTGLSAPTPAAVSDSGEAVAVAAPAEICEQEAVSLPATRQPAVARTADSTRTPGLPARLLNAGRSCFGFCLLVLV